MRRTHTAILLAAMADNTGLAQADIKIGICRVLHRSGSCHRAGHETHSCTSARNRARFKDQLQRTRRRKRLDARRPERPQARERRHVTHRSHCRNRQSGHAR